MEILNWRLIAECRVLADSVVKDFDIFEARGFHFGTGRVAHAIVSLVLEAGKPALGRSVVPAIPFATHRACHAKRPERILKGMAGILGEFILISAIGMMHHAGSRSAAKPCHRQRVRHDVGSHARLERPADHFPIEQIQNDRQIQLAFVRPQIGSRP